MADQLHNGPVFHFEQNTTGNLGNRKIRFIRKSNIGYVVEYLRSPEADAVPEIMRGARPDVEFTGRKLIPHEDLTAALLDGTLDIDEDNFIFIDHSQTFKPEFVASLDDRPAQDLILRYATVTVMRELCAEKGIIRITRSAVKKLEAEITELLQPRIDLLTDKVDTRRRHPMRRKKSPEKCATAQWILEWDRRLREKGFCSLVDRRHDTGRTGPRLHPVVADVLAAILKEYVTLEKLTLKRLHSLAERDVLAARAEAQSKLLLRQQDGDEVSQGEWDELEKIVPPCIETIRRWKRQMSPLVLAFSTKGPDWLFRNQLVTGMGLQVDRAGQILIIDEYDSDLMVIVPYEFLVHWLGQKKLNELGIFEGKPLRVKLSVIIDAFTGCILGLQFDMNATPELAKRTIMMSMMDKTKVSTACGTKGDWKQCLRAEKILHDSGNAYLAAVTDALCAQLRIDKLAAPKAKAFIRGMMERIFRTLHETLLSSIPGKTFSNPVMRGDYNSEAEAILSLDDLARILVIWIVDIYHNTENYGRDGLCPADLWDHEMLEGMGCRPVPGLRTMSHVFGTTLTRTAQTTGIRIMHVNYSSEEFARELLNNPKRRFRVRWWEENMSYIQVEIRPRVWLPVGVMDPEARGLSVDEWILLLKRRHIRRNPEAAATRRQAQEEIDALVADSAAMRRKLARRSLQAEADVRRLEEKLLRYFVTPTTMITSEQTHGLYGVPVGDLPLEDVGATVDQPESPSDDNTKAPSKDAVSQTLSKRAAPAGRRKTTVWQPGTKE